MRNATLANDTRRHVPASTLRDMPATGALFSSQEALERAIVELGRLGRSRHALALAARRAETLARFAREYGVAPIGATGDVARGLIAAGIDEACATYFAERIREGALLLVVPQVRDGGRARTALAETGADFGQPATRGEEPVRSDGLRSDRRTNQ